MTGSLLDGKFVASEIKNKIKQEISDRTKYGFRAPGLAVVLLGADPASSIYVMNKRKACLEVGIKSFAYDLPMDTTEFELLSLIDRLNNAEDIDGILVQLPLPAHLNTSTIIEHINPSKDVDGFHPYNLGRLAQANPLLRPCTPYGIIQLIDHYELKMEGRHTVVVGASNIVGRPMALELLLAKATVTICHRATRHLEGHIKMADIVIIATGVKNLINPSWLNAHQIIIDVGIHRRQDGSIRGDLDFNQAKDKVAWITPVPGGVGPMTISVLLQNTLSSAMS